MTEFQRSIFQTYLQTLPYQIKVIEIIEEEQGETIFLLLHPEEVKKRYQKAF